MDDVFITAIIFAFGFAALKLLFDYLKAKNQSKVANDGSSMKTSELRSLIRDAVEEAFDARFEGVEKRLDRSEEPRLIPASGRARGELEPTASGARGQDQDAAS